MLTTAAAASFVTVSSSSVLFHRVPYRSRPPPSSFLVSSLPRARKGTWGHGYALIPVNCVSERSKQTGQTETETDTAPSPSSLESGPSSSSTYDGGDDMRTSSYKWLVGLGGIGFLETAYLTFLKFTNSDAFCPTGGGSCSSILNSEYSYVFGLPLPLIGMFAYGFVATIGFQLGTKERTFETGKTDGEVILLGITSSMAVASAYFLYILNTEFAGELCIYCLASAILSFSLFFTTVKRFKPQELQNVMGLQLFIVCLVVIALTTSYYAAEPDSSRLAETEIPYFETEITTESSPLSISLAKHLQSIGAKLYGAFWCSHCHEQKEIFGREAARLLDYVECFPDGASKDTKMAQACYDVKLEAFPTWVIKGQVLSGEKQLSELAAISGFTLEDQNK